MYSQMWLMLRGPLGDVSDKYNCLGDDEESQVGLNHVDAVWELTATHRTWRCGATLALATVIKFCGCEFV